MISNPYVLELDLLAMTLCFPFKNSLEGVKRGAEQAELVSFVETSCEKGKKRLEEVVEGS